MAGQERGREKACHFASPLTIYGLANRTSQTARYLTTSAQSAVRYGNPGRRLTISGRLLRENGRSASQKRTLSSTIT